MENLDCLSKEKVQYEEIRGGEGCRLRIETNTPCQGLLSFAEKTTCLMME